MAENYDKIIDKVDKYYYFIMNKKKLVKLSSGDNLSDVKKGAIKKLEPSIEKLIGHELIYVKIENTYKQYKDNKKHPLKLIGGPIAFEIMTGIIENKKKIKNVQEKGNNRFYLSKKYIRENINNISKDIKKTVKHYLKNFYTESVVKVNVL